MNTENKSHCIGGCMPRLNAPAWAAMVHNVSENEAGQYSKYFEDMKLGETRQLEDDVILEKRVIGQRE